MSSSVRVPAARPAPDARDAPLTSRRPARHPSGRRRTVRPRGTRGIALPFSSITSRKAPGRAHPHRHPRRRPQPRHPRPRRRRQDHRHRADPLRDGHHPQTGARCTRAPPSPTSTRRNATGASPSSPPRSAAPGTAIASTSSTRPATSTSPTRSNGRCASSTERWPCSTPSPASNRRASPCGGRPTGTASRGSCSSTSWTAPAPTWTGPSPPSGTGCTPRRWSSSCRSAPRTASPVSWTWCGCGPWCGATGRARPWRRRCPRRCGRRPYGGGVRWRRRSPNGIRPPWRSSATVRRSAPRP